MGTSIGYHCDLCDLYIVIFIGYHCDLYVTSIGYHCESAASEVGGEVLQTEGEGGGGGESLHSCGQDVGDWRCHSDRPGLSGDCATWLGYVMEEGESNFILLFVSGNPVLVVNGAYRGTRAILESIDIDKFCATIKIDQVPK